MAASSFFDRVKVGVTAAPGTGAASLGNAVAGFRTFDQAGVPDQGLVSYVIEDGGNAWEVGQGTYTKSGASLARSPSSSSASDGKSTINASAAAVLYITVTAADLAALGSSGSSGTTAATYSRYRMFMNSNGGGPNYALAELSYGDTNHNTQTASSAVATSQGYGNASNAIDGNTSTNWVSDGGPPANTYLDLLFNTPFTAGSVSATSKSDAGDLKQNPLDVTIFGVLGDGTTVKIKEFVFATWTAAGQVQVISLTS